jgi:hypothetical protein
LENHQIFKLSQLQQSLSLYIEKVPCPPSQEKSPSSLAQPEYVLPLCYSFSRTDILKGIGAAIAVALAKQGAHVVVNYVSSSSKARAEEVAKAVESHGSKSLVVQANLASLEDLDTLVQKTVAQFGKIDILVNNGGVGEFQPVGGIVSPSSIYSFRTFIDCRRTDQGKLL